MVRPQPYRSWITIEHSRRPWDSLLLPARSLGACWKRILWPSCDRGAEGNSICLSASKPHEKNTAIHLSVDRRCSFWGNLYGRGAVVAWQSDNRRMSDAPALAMAPEVQIAGIVSLPPFRIRVAQVRIIHPICSDGLTCTASWVLFRRSLRARRTVEKWRSWDRFRCGAGWLSFPAGPDGDAAWRASLSIHCRTSSGRGVLTGDLLLDKQVGRENKKRSSMIPGGPQVDHHTAP